MNLALMHLEEMRVAGQTPTVNTYTSLIDCCCRVGRLEDALHLLAEMRGAGVQPNTATFTCLLDGVGKAGRVDDAFGVLATMQQCAVAPNVATFTALLSACMHSSDAERAAHALQMMPSYGLDPAALPPHLLRSVELHGSDLGEDAGPPLAKQVFQSLHSALAQPRQETACHRMHQPQMNVRMDATAALRFHGAEIRTHQAARTDRSRGGHTAQHFCRAH